MSIQEWKNHQTYLIFPHVLEVCFLEKARKNPKWVKRNVVKDFPQHYRVNLSKYCHPNDKVYQVTGYHPHYDLNPHLGLKNVENCVEFN